MRTNIVEQLGKTELEDILLQLAAIYTRQADKTQQTQITDGTRQATVRDTGTNDSLNVSIVDAAGNQITSFGSGVVQYTEDDASAANPTGDQIIGRRRDALAVETTTDGDVTALNCTGKGELYVKHVDSVPITAASLPLPTGAATEATLATMLTLTGFQARINTLGQKTMANSTPVVIASDQSTLAISAASLPLPTGAATEATLATMLTLAGFQARINTLGQKTMANSTPVVLSSDQSAIPITDNAGSLTIDTTQLPAALVGGRLDSNVGAWLGSTAPTVGQKTMANSVPVAISSDQSTLAISAASLPLPTGAATEATLAGVLTTTAFQARINTLGQKTMANSTPVVLSSDQSVIPINDNAGSLTVDTTQLPAALVGGRLDTNVGAWFGSTAPTVGTKTSANSIPVVLASDQAALFVTEVRSSTGTQTSVAGSAASVTILAANANRRGASIYNDSTAILYIRMQATASTSNFSVKLFPEDFYEVPFGYTGIIDGIWASATGNARVTEYT